MKQLFVMTTALLNSTVTPVTVIPAPLVINGSYILKAGLGVTVEVNAESDMMIETTDH